MKNAKKKDRSYHPMQDIVLVDGITRFRANEIVRLLLDTGKLDLNDVSLMVARGVYSEEDYTQLMQLIGYSVSGYGDLSTSPRELVREADERVERLLMEHANNDA